MRPLGMKLSSTIISAATRQSRCKIGNGTRGRIFPVSKLQLFSFSDNITQQSYITPAETPLISRHYLWHHRQCSVSILPDNGWGGYPILQNHCGGFGWVWWGYDQGHCQSKWLRLWSRWTERVWDSRAVAARVNAAAPPPPPQLPAAHQYYSDIIPRQWLYQQMPVHG